MDDTPARVSDRPDVSKKSLDERAREAGVPSRAETEHIHREIEATRADMSETIDAIQERLRPENIAAEARDRVRDAARDKVSSLARTARHKAEEMMARDSWSAAMLRRMADNPVPTALTGVGLAWLAFAGQGRRRDYGYDEEHYGRRSYSEPGTSWREADDYGRSADYGRQDEEPGIVARTQDATGRVTARVRVMTQGAGSQTRRAQSQLQRFMHRNPLMAGAGAFVLGALVGLVVPETERENAMMGETRDDLLERAQERTREMAETAAESVREAAGQAASQVVSKMTGTGEESQSQRPSQA